MKLKTRTTGLVAALFVLAACGSPAAGPDSSPGGSPAAPGGSPADTPATTTAGDGADLLAEVREKGVLRISTDADYAPQSSVTESGDFEGFDIDVGEEIASRLGVTAEWTAQNWDAVVAGNWAGRWDMSVGSMTITPERVAEVFDMTQPYYFTPAVVALVEDSGLSTLEDLAGEVACVGEDTTYLYWVDGTLTLGQGGEIVSQPPEGLTATTLPTDANCAEALRAGRRDFAAFISAEPTVDEALAAGAPLVKLDEPIFYEPLGIAFDKNGPVRSELLAEVDRIIGEMHADGTLSELSMKWYEKDLTETD